MSLTVAVTGPTGEIGVPFVNALEREPEVGRVLAMARRPFDPADRGWRKTEYRQGDILDRGAIDALIADADVVVHLAFIVVQASSDSYDVNIDGSRNVFEATVAARIPRLIYTSSVAAYGYQDDVDGLLTEDMPTRGTDRHAYSQQKAEVERVLQTALASSESTQAYVFRPCVVAGPHAPALLNQLPYVRLEKHLPAAVVTALGLIPGVTPILPDHGVPFQLVHHDDVAEALLAAVLGRGTPGIYNLAADGTVSVSDIAAELGWRTFPIAKGAVEITARVLAQIPPLAVEAGWLQALRTPMMMDCARAHRDLDWQPTHDAQATLHEMVAAHR
jgi:nucleoside-diphosphate-sugar epimerase